MLSCVIDSNSGFTERCNVVCMSFFSSAACLLMKSNSSKNSLIAKFSKLLKTSCSLSASSLATNSTLKSASGFELLVKRTTINFEIQLEYMTWLHKLEKFIFMRDIFMDRRQISLLILSELTRMN